MLDPWFLAITNFTDGKRSVLIWLKPCWLNDAKLSFIFQDNVFVTVVASVQYRALADKAADAFYKLSNTREQIQAYVFDGMLNSKCILFADGSV